MLGTEEEFLNQLEPLDALQGGLLLPTYVTDATVAWEEGDGPRTEWTGAALTTTVAMVRQSKQAVTPRQKVTTGNARTTLLYVVSGQFWL